LRDGQNWHTGVAFFSASVKLNDMNSGLFSIIDDDSPEYLTIMRIPDFSL
jgi:hypothetical protein